MPDQPNLDLERVACSRTLDALQTTLEHVCPARLVWLGHRFAAMLVVAAAEAPPMIYQELIPVIAQNSDIFQEEAGD